LGTQTEIILLEHGKSFFRSVCLENNLVQQLNASSTDDEGPNLKYDLDNTVYNRKDQIERGDPGQRYPLPLKMNKLVFK
jgi:hypothetical protein